ncbi:lysylphosphatidylglycerol synthase domain-containing protein [Neorhizobium sp. JUb45]|uniref:lysylphosphatidylglycerol synthase domain-containing protein n=1 Tax=unclassified Neorhizobium TaxID=2629175 RepID=UPI00104B6181|nr:lysylphosphatidylglycerol synthase domain-containing protein [Neorhizobium sp. JUb45]TCR04350.1 lysylphosphatidylglycerol synthase-like protein [Neorhizobium sp. JUb45]
MKNDPVASQGPWIIRNAMWLGTVAIILAYALFIEWFWGWLVIVERWQKAGWGAAVLAIVLLLTTYVLRTWRIYDYFPAETMGRFGVLLRLVQVHNLLNVMMPFRTGEASFPLLMRREFDVPLARSTSALLVMRLFDLHALLAAAAVGKALSMYSQGYGGWVWLLWLTFLVLPAIAFALRGRAVEMLAKILPSSGKGAKLERLVEEAAAGLPANNAAFARAWGATLVNWFVKVAVLAWVLVLLCGLDLGAAFGGGLGGELSSVLPVHAPAGVGTYPAGITAGAIAFGAPTTKAALETLGQAAVNAHLLIIMSSLIGTALSLLVARGAKAGG